jgi:hypothetical protein
MAETGTLWSTAGGAPLVGGSDGATVVEGDAEGDEGVDAGGEVVRPPGG